MANDLGTRVARAFGAYFSVVVVGFWISVVVLMALSWSSFRLNPAITWLSVGTTVVIWILAVRRFIPYWWVPLAALTFGLIEVLFNTKSGSGNASYEQFSTWLALAGISAAIAFPRHWWQAVLLASVPGFAVAILLHIQTGEPEIRMIVMSPTAAILYGMLAGSVINAVTVSGRQEDAAVAAKLRSADFNTYEQSLRTEQFRLDRVLHDSVINTLGAMKTVSTDDEVEAARYRARADVARLNAEWQLGEAGTRVGSVDSLATALRERAVALRVALDVSVEGNGDEIPTGALSAIFGALEEALNNTSKHTNDRHAKLRIRFDEASVLARYEDSGLARMSPDSSTRGGVALSIRQRCLMNKVRADVVQRDGRGWLELQWLKDEGAELPTTDTSSALLSKILLVVTMQVTGWLTARHLMEMVLDWSYSPWWWWLTLTAISLGAIAVAVVAASRKLPLGNWLALGLVVLGFLTAMMLAFQPADCSMPAYGWWAAERALTIGLAVTLLTTGARWAVASSATLVAGSIIGSQLLNARTGCEVSMWIFLATYAEAILLLWLVRRSLQVRAASASAAFTEIRRSRAQTAHERAVDEVRRRRWLEGVHDVLPFLAAIGDGSLDPREPDVARQAAQYEHKLRNRILLAEVAAPLADAMLAACEVGYARDVLVHVTPAASAPPPNSDTIRELLSQLLRAAVPGSEARLTLFSFDDTELLTCVVTTQAVEGDLHAVDLEIRAERDRDQLIVEISWPSTPVTATGIDAADPLAAPVT